jgi:hypothetical protein
MHKTGGKINQLQNNNGLSIKIQFVRLFSSLVKIYVINQAMNQLRSWKVWYVIGSWHDYQMASNYQP